MPFDVQSPDLADHDTAFAHFPNRILSVNSTALTTIVNGFICVESWERVESVLVARDRHILCAAVTIAGHMFILLDDDRIWEALMISMHAALPGVPSPACWTEALRASDQGMCLFQRLDLSLGC